MRSRARGFTLVEILIVVIILGILAAIVIPCSPTPLATRVGLLSPRRCNRSGVRSNSSKFSTRTCHRAPPCLPPFLAASRTRPDTNTTVASGTLGPYVQSFPTNPVSGFSTVVNAAGTTAGWVYTVASGQSTFWAADTTGTGTLSY